MRRRSAHQYLLVFGLLAAGLQPVLAADERQGGKLLLTNGVSTVDGSAGGGLATWAVIAGDETKDGIGGTAHATVVALPDFTLQTYGAAIGIHDRLELSYAWQSFDTGKAGAALGLGRGYTFGQHVIGAKLRVIGDAVYDQDRWLPQIAVGVQHRIATRDTIIHAVGGEAASGTDFYVSATKLLLAESIVLNGTLRFTKANQFGLLGFGGDRDDDYSAQVEGSAAMLATRRLALGAEYRSKPDNLGFAREQDSYDLFAAWALQRHLSLTAAYADLGDIATFRRQRGAFLSLQAGF